jgi:hypothetical protein
MKTPVKILLTILISFIYIIILIFAYEKDNFIIYLFIDLIIFVLLLIQIFGSTKRKTNLVLMISFLVLFGILIIILNNFGNIFLTDVTDIYTNKDENENITMILYISVLLSLATSIAFMIKIFSNFKNEVLLIALHFIIIGYQVLGLGDITISPIILIISYIILFPLAIMKYKIE